jgi:ArsR family transcriptional regulator
LIIIDSLTDTSIAVNILFVEVKTIEACCSPVLASALDAAQADDLADAFKVLADPVRLRLLSMVANAPAGEACGCDLVEPLGRSQPTVSHHLGVLVDAGLLAREKRGRWAWYRVVPERLAVLQEALHG